MAVTGFPLALVMSEVELAELERLAVLDVLVGVA
jgi:hypothetical protein